tara:strand:+ start:208 stop:1113 length:906 start_codon:yes stop_codon:yes gene_type:complete
MKKNNKIIISSSDSKYFKLLLELYHSVKNNDLLEEYDFGVLDTGLDKLQINSLENLGVIIKKAEWNTSISEIKVRGRNHLKTQFARAFLPDYFENYTIYIWLDADTWINHKETFLMFEKGCKNNKLSITPQTDRAYGKYAKIDWFLGFPKKIRTINYKNISKSVSYSLGRKYALHPTLNAGAFAINDDSKLWKIFQKNIILASKRGRIFGTDQVALALSVYEDNLPVEFLPAYTNWMCEFYLPRIDNNKSYFIEPYLPHHPIGLIHLAGLDDIRNDESILSEIQDQNGLIMKKTLRYHIHE